MAVSYTFETCSRLEAGQVLNLVSEQFSFDWKDGKLKNEYLEVYIYALDEFDIEVTEAAFKFRPNISIGFRLNPDYLESATQAMLKVVLFLLNYFSQDAVLLFDGEIIVLQRIAGELKFNRQQWHPWVSNVAEGTSLTYEVIDLPSPLL